MSRDCHLAGNPTMQINILSHLRPISWTVPPPKTELFMPKLLSWMDIYRVTRCVLGLPGVTAAGIYALRLLKAGCASSADGSLRPLCDRFRAENFHDEGPPLCDGCRAWFFHIDKTTPARRTTPGSSMREAKISEGPPAFKDSIAQMAGKMVFVQFI